MLNYELKELPAFSVIGLEQALTNQKSKNLERCLSFWPRFNAQLKSNGLSQSNGNWTKFAFMERREGQLYYYCAIPRLKLIPTNFISKDISAGKYLVVTHQGAMNQIYTTYEAIYQELIPKLGLTLAQTNFLHFEKYDQRFHWNRKDSIIELWIPVKIEQT